MIFRRMSFRRLMDSGAEEFGKFRITENSDAEKSEWESGRGIGKQRE